jgi:hypothetical protein
MLPASAKHKTISAIKRAAIKYAAGLAGPSNDATVAGKTKIPEPMTPFTAMAISPKSPTALMNRGAVMSVKAVGLRLFNGFWTAGSEANNFKSQISNRRFQITDFKSQISNHRLPLQTHTLNLRIAIDNRNRQNPQTRNAQCK